MTVSRTRPQVAWVAVEPTPYRMPLFQSLRNNHEMDIHIFVCNQNALQPWSLDQKEEIISPVSNGLRICFRGKYFNPGIISAVMKQRWDAVVISGYSHLTMQAAILCCLGRGIPFILEGDTHLLRRRRWFKKLMKRLFLFPVLRRCSAATGVGILAKRYWENIGISEDRVFIVPYPCHLDLFRSKSAEGAAGCWKARLELGIPVDSLVAIFVGRLVAVKAVDVLLEALDMVDPDCRPHLLVVGDGPERASLERMASQKSLPVTFAGFRHNHELPALYTASDFFVLASRDEPWGVVVSEAMASGLPVVLSDQIGAAYDLLEDGQNGFLVPAGVVEAWRDVLQRCVNEKHNLKAMGEKSRAIVSGWTYEGAAQQLLAAVEIALGGQSRDLERHTAES